jgi:hypothetical protein
MRLIVSFTHTLFLGNIGQVSRRVLCAARVSKLNPDAVRPDLNIAKQNQTITLLSAHHFIGYKRRLLAVFT